MGTLRDSGAVLRVFKNPTKFCGISVLAWEMFISRRLGREMNPHRWGFISRPSRREMNISQAKTEIPQNFVGFLKTLKTAPESLRVPMGGPDFHEFHVFSIPVTVF